MSEHNKPLDMRYDGAPRRSQKADQDGLDRVWSFFSSVKVGVWLIVLTLLGAAIGSIFPQEEAFLTPPGAGYYEERYGWLGKMYYLLGFSRTYTSWWFQLLVVLLGTSIVIASLDRGIPLYKALKRQKPLRPVEFLRRQGVTYEAALPYADGDADRAAKTADEVEAVLRKLRFRTNREGLGVLGEKNRWSRWGPYVNHLGLIIFLLIALVRTLPGFTMEEYIDILEGDTVRIGDTDYYIKNADFTVEYHENSGTNRSALVPSLFKTEAVVYECTARCGTSDPELAEALRGETLVNHPLQFRGMSIYQYGYRETPQLRSVAVALRDKQTGEAYGKFTLRTVDPDLSYEAGPYKLRLHNYYPEFTLGANGEPATASAVRPNAPAYVFMITGPDLPQEGVSFIYFPLETDKLRFGQDRLNASVGTGERFEISADGMEDVEVSLYTSTIAVRKDLTVPYLLVGGAICMLGLVMGFYWQHRRIWVRIDGNRLTLGAHTNKNWHGMKSETARLLDAIGLDGKSVTATAPAGERSKEENRP